MHSAAMRAAFVPSMLTVWFVLLLTCTSRGVSGAIEISEYSYGIFRAIQKDERQRYELRDTVVATPARLHSHGNVFAHSTLTGVVNSAQISINGDKQNELCYNVDHHNCIISVTVNDPNDNEVSARVTFNEAAYIYGLPERAADLLLKDGIRYRLFTQDIFKYAVPHDQGLYGAIPFVMAVSKSGRAVGFFWHNAADTSFTFESTSTGRAAVVTSSGGAADFFVLPGPTALDVQRQFSYLTGKPQLPPLFSVAYHQCRWNYRSEEDVLQVDENFDKYDIPYDVIWLDIEHTDGKKYFTWDSYNFATPEKMQETIADKGRKMVTISDPHIKRSPGYHVFDEASSKGYFVKNSAGNGDYEGHCWPGTSSWIDFTNPEAREWYAGLYKYDRYKGSTPHLYTWIDMNEPAVFNSHEQTFDMNNQHFGGVKHRDVHNQYGFYHAMATYQGHIVRSSGPPHDTQVRPFVLTRSFFPGSQRYAAAWTGDNTAQWSHLEIMTPMILSLSLSGFPFIGADVGGFFDNPEEELMVRWMQASALTPFFRNHAHLETKRREPWLFGDRNTELLRSAISMRYRVLPYVYTIFFESHREGTSVVNPLFFYYNDEQAYTSQDSFLLGQNLLVYPVAKPGVNHVSIFAPGPARWYDFYNGEAHAAGVVGYNAPIEKGVPILQRAGSIVPLRERHRRSSSAQRNDPFTLQIALDSDNSATGSLYVDDGNTFKYKHGAYIYRQFTWKGNQLISVNNAQRTPYSTHYDHTETYPTTLHIERIRVFGVASEPKSVTIEYPQGTPAFMSTLTAVAPTAVKQQLHYEYTNGVLTIRRPQALIAADWIITVT